MAVPPLSPEDEVYAKSLSDVLGDAAGLSLDGPLGAQGGAGGGLDVGRALEVGQLIVDQLLGQGRPASGAPRAEGGEQLAAAFASLEGEQRAALDELAARVSGRLRLRVAARLEPLLAPAFPSAR